MNINLILELLQVKKDLPTWFIGLFKSLASNFWLLGCIFDSLIKASKDSSLFVLQLDLFFFFEATECFHPDTLEKKPRSFKGYKIKNVFFILMALPSVQPARQYSEEYS